MSDEVVQALVDEDHEQLIIEFDLDMAKACGIEDQEACESCQ